MNTFFAMRKAVTPGPGIQCSTKSPLSVSPSSSPTFRPSVNPTPLPTHSPTIKPSSAPTSSRPSFSPTMEPSAAPTSSKPTRSPTFSPTTSIPTGTPSKTPSSSPTKCVPGIVTCCLTMQDTFVQLYVNDQDITSKVETAANFGNDNIAKIVSFVEPSTDAIIALKGTHYTEVTFPGLMLKCVCSRPGCAWNFDSSVSSGWFSIEPTDILTDSFPSNWFSPSFTGTTHAALLDTQTYYNLNTNVCGSINSAHRIRAYQKDPSTLYFTMRKSVAGTNCGTNSPFSPLPTTSPTTSPSTSIPTATPTTSSPSLRPTTSIPSKAPTTLNPSFSPSQGPATYVPTSSPVGTNGQKSSTSSFAPTNSPQVACPNPGTVSCCFGALDSVTGVYLNGVDLTSSVYPQSYLTLPGYVKTINFTEPTTPSILAIEILYNAPVGYPAVAMSCTCSRVGSRWNFVSTAGDSSWSSVTAATRFGNNLPSGWMETSYSGTTHTLPLKLAGIFQARPSCLSTSAADLGVFNGPSGATIHYLGVRKYVDQNC